MTNVRKNHAMLIGSGVCAVVRFMDIATKQRIKARKRYHQPLSYGVRGVLFVPVFVMCYRYRTSRVTGQWKTRSGAVFTGTVDSACSASRSCLFVIAHGERVQGARIQAVAGLCVHKEETGRMAP